MEQTRSSDTIAHLKNELVVSGQYLKDQNLPLLISRGVFGHLSVSWGLTVTSEKNISLGLEILMQTVQFSPFLLFLAHSVRVVQYKLVEHTKK